MNGCRNLERFFADYKLSVVILVHSTGKIGEHLKEGED
jgi:hypothetical protein